MSNHIDRALQFDVALPIEAQADRHELVAGESLPVHVNFSGEPAVPVKWRLNDKSIVVPSGWTVEVTKEQEENHGADFEVKIPARAKSALAPSDVILPFPPPLV